MTHNSSACMTLPVAEGNDYTPKGLYTTLADTKTYITGPASANRAIVFLYDVFGFLPPTIQGADILASAGFLVAMPDLFQGKAMQLEWLARDTDEKREKASAFSKSIQDPKPHIARIEQILVTLKQEYKGVRHWGAIGYCWGGKLVALTSGGVDSPWAAGVQSSPARIDPEDAKRISTPHMVLASKDEPADSIKAFDEALHGTKVVETFDTQIHGWMSARADLKDPEVKKEYERGYKMAIDFFTEHL